MATAKEQHRKEVASSSHDRDHQGERYSPPDRDDSQYEEISESFTIPTKTGSEDLVSGIACLNDESRPTSAHTTHSSQFEFEGNDLALLDANSASISRVENGCEQFNTPPPSGLLLIRREAVVGSSAPGNFSFSPALMPQFSFNRNTKAHIAPGPSVGETNGAANIQIQGQPSRSIFCIFH